MAKSKIPNALERRHLMERQLGSTQALAIGEAYLAEGRSLDAVAFLVKAEAVSALDALTEEAVQNGDAFLLRNIAETRGIEFDGATWERVADAASDAGKDLYAELARTQAQRCHD
ncbi:MAG: hypothetical protein VCC02_01915 [Myxococcota bacterium]|jgi:hypothetical protein